MKGARGRLHPAERGKRAGRDGEGKQEEDPAALFARLCSLLDFLEDVREMRSEVLAHGSGGVGDGGGGRGGGVFGCVRAV